MMVLVTREAYVDSPHKVLAYSGSPAETIERHYPGAVVDRMGGFDTADGGSYLYDVTSVE